MKFVVKKLRAAEDDIVAAAVWYDGQVPGLGDEFLDEVEATVNALAHDALIHSVRFADVRCVRFQRFRKYGAYYLVQGSEVWVLAIFHGSRHPRWLHERRQSLE